MVFACRIEAMVRQFEVWRALVLTSEG